jgi:hypothetical protein
VREAAVPERRGGRGAEPVSAFALMPTHRLTVMEGEDSAQVLVRFDNGASGRAEDVLRV